MRFLFLNQYFPPDPAPTGILLQELGECLRAHGHTVEFVSSKQSYRSSKKNQRRIIKEITALGSLFLRGMSVERPDVVFSASSPPCLLIAAALIAARHGAKSVHWLMDFYPEIAIALGEINEGFGAYLIRKLMGWAYRRTDIVTALDTDMADRLKPYGVAAEIIPPWVLQPLIANVSDAAPDGALTWIYSGNLGRAHEWETLLGVQAILEGHGLSWRLLFQGGGPAWPQARAKAEAMGLKQCIWNGYVPESELQQSLLHCHVLVVTQRPETQGLLWPSKMAMVSTLPRPILWVGPKEGAIAQQLRKMPGTGIFAPGEAEKIADWLQAVEQSIGEGKPKRMDARQDRDQSLKKWKRLLENLENPGSKE